MDFIGEFRKLILSQPVYSLRSVKNENCPYVHMLSYSRNSYMCYSGYKCDSCGYCFYPSELRDCWDTFFCVQCELCYECVSCTGCYGCMWCEECMNCRDSAFSYDCKGCSDCFGCVGLRRKEFHIFNRPYSREEYFRELKSFDLRSSVVRREIEDQVEKLRLKHPHLASIQTQTENCTGNHIVRSKNCHWAFGMTDGEDNLFTYHTMDNNKDCCDTGLMATSELLYECVVGYDNYNCNFLLECGNVKNSQFCVRCFNSNNLFGCASRDRAEYEILNKKYSKEEWHKRVAEITNQLKAEGNYRNILPDVVEIEW